MNIESIGIPTRSELIDEFELIKNSVYNGVKGVWCVSSGLKGPSVGVTIHTHGNEPSGLAALWYMRHKFHLWDKLLCGRVFFVLNNIRATKRYFAACTKLEKLEARFVDANMNRLPANLSELTRDRRYEIRRARELLPVWQEFTAALDIHSTAKQSPPMIIGMKGGRATERLIRDFPIEIIVSNNMKNRPRKSASSFYGNPDKQIPAVGIEAGSHENKSSFAVAVTCVKLFLATTGVIEKVPVPKRLLRRHTYVMGGSVIFPDPSWRLTKIFRMFEPIRKGQILAVGGNGQTIRAPFTGVTLFGPPQKQAVKLEDEILFLARRRNS